MSLSNWILAAIIVAIILVAYVLPVLLGLDDDPNKPSELHSSDRYQVAEDIEHDLYLKKVMKLKSDIKLRDNLAELVDGVKDEPIIF